MAADFLQGTLDLLILRVCAESPRHGYAIAQRIGQLSRALLNVPQGSLYPALHRLEHKKLLAATWVQTDAGRDAKIYRLTAKGRRALDAEIRQWQQVSQAIGFVLQDTAE